MVCTVHDSVLIDCPEKEVDKVVELCYQTFEEFPSFWKKVFNSDFNVPLKVEVQTGPNWGDMKDYIRKA